MFGDEYNNRLNAVRDGNLFLEQETVNFLSYQFKYRIFK